MVIRMQIVKRIARRAALTTLVSVTAIPCALILGAFPALSTAHQTLTSSDSPLTDDPLGPIENVTADWTYYQPASDFCITPDVYELPAYTGSPCKVAVGSATTTGTYEVKISAPALCPTCARIFIDYSKIAANNGTNIYSHGHAFFKVFSLNLTYSADPVAHSPNIKNLTNDYLVSPPGSVISAVMGQLDTSLLTFAADTANYAHNDVQGPYYVGPGYVDAAGNWIDGAYVDINLANATELGNNTLDQVTYGAGFNSDPPSCLDSVIGGPAFADANYFYAGCVNGFGASNPAGVSPWPDGN